MLLQNVNERFVTRANERHPPGKPRQPLSCKLERRRVAQGTLMRATIHLVSKRDYWPIAVGVRRARREAWLRDQYHHPEEHRHTLGEVQRWFAENGVEYVRAYPSALLAGESDDLFAPAGDDWAVEQWLAQVGWMEALGHEGGLFITVGRRGVSMSPVL